MRNIYMLLLLGGASVLFGGENRQRTAAEEQIQQNIEFFKKLPKPDPRFLLVPPDFTKIPSYEEGSRIVNGAVAVKPKATPQYVDDLVRQIRQKDASNEQRVFAIYLLGELHTTNAEAVKVLIDKIDLRAPRGDLLISVPRWATYPAQEALGKQFHAKSTTPALVAIVESLSIETNVLRRNLLCGTLTGIETKEGGERRINRKLDRETDPARQANLRLALQEMEQIARYTSGQQTLPQIGPTDKSVR